MKHRSILVFFILCMALTRSANACTDDCTPNELTIPPVISGEIPYISGGIGVCEASAMRGIINDYPLSLVFIQKLGNREEFIADVKVQVQDASQHLLLDIATEGPYLFIKLPNGKYLITATFNDVIKQQWINVRQDKNQYVVFWWPIQDLQE